MKLVFIIGFLFKTCCILSQDSTIQKSTWSLSGYIKDIGWVRFSQRFVDPAFTNLIHNRINLHWNAAKKWSGRLEFRNRFYYGDDVKSIPGFKQMLRNQNEAFNLSLQPFNTTFAILHTNVERAWIEYRKKKWNLRAGRQRINWGITNTWNPNDLFNTYNFLDFDYEERPGSDAVKAQYMVNDLSNIEIAAAATGNRPILAARYFTNYHQYDLQVNAGTYQNHFTVGIGWAGSIGNVGFKGESQYFSTTRDSASRLLLSLEGDYTFKKGWYLSAAFLYNEKGLDSSVTDFSKLSFSVSPRNLMPTKWNLLVTASKEFTPLFSGNISIMYAPAVNLFILFPTFKYNLQTNLDLDLVWQSFFISKGFQDISHTAFLRLRWSF